MDTRELVKLLREDTQTGMKQAIDTYGGAVKKICASVLSGYQNQDIEEAVADTFVGLWRSVANGNYKGDTEIKYYLYGIARTVALNKKRKLAKGVQAEDIDEVVKVAKEDTEEQAVNAVEYQILRQLLLDFKSPYKEIFIYRYFEQYSVKEIAEKLQLSAKAVENKLTRGRGKLKKELEKIGIVM